MYTIPQVKQLTNFYGKVVTDDITQPNPGSVVLSGGPHGTAWQRHFKDGKWHRTGGGRGRTWREVMAHRNLVLVYAAAPRARDLQSESDALADLGTDNDGTVGL